MYRLEITKKIANGGVVTIVVTALLSALFWFIPVLIFPATLPDVPFRFMGIELFSLPVNLSRYIAFCFWLIIWYIVNVVCEKVHIIPVRSVMPFVVGMAIVSANPQMQLFDAGMVAFAFFLVALFTIFDLYSVSNQVNESFKVILLILVSSLFVPEYIWMIIVFFLGLVVFKVRSPRIFFSVFVALLVFAWMVWGICFSIGKADVFSSYLVSLVDFGFFGFHGSLVRIAGSVLMLIAMIVVMIAVAGMSRKFDARVRLNTNFINLAFLFALPLMVFTRSVNEELLLVVVLLFTMLSALYFSVQRSNYSNIFFLVSLSLLLLYRVAYGLIKIEI